MNNEELQKDYNSRSKLDRNVARETDYSIERPVRVSDLKSDLRVGVDLESCATLLANGGDLRTAVEDAFHDLVVHDTP